jgi:sugar lactone lactonase YvrE
MEEVEVSVLCDIECELGEGPTYDPVSGSLFWLDIPGRKLLERKWSGSETLVHPLPENTSALAVVDDARQLLLTQTGLYLRDTATAALSLVKELEADNPATRSNDARVHPCGAFWVSTMSRNVERGGGAIYWYMRGELTLLFPNITIANSICFSPDGATAYFADTGSNILYRVACDPATGLPTAEPQILLDHGGVEGGFDGSVVDADGLIWNARWGSGALDCYAPDSKHLRRISVPAIQTTCPAFAGPDATSLVVTSAWQGMDTKRRASDPHAGKTFLIGHPVRGRHEPRVAL